MGTWIHRRYSTRAYPSPINSWVAGAVDSAWRVVDQYLALNQPHRREEFWGKWGGTEYSDGESSSKLVKLNRELVDRHLVNSPHKAGVKYRRTENA